MGNNYYSQIFLKECKYVVKENKISKFINDELEISSSDEASEEEQIKTKYYECLFEKTILMIAD